MHRNTSRPTSLLVCAASTVLSLIALAGCGGTAKKDGSPGGATTGAKSVTTGSGSSPSGSSSSGSAAGATLSAAQIKKALPTVSDLPKGWKVDPTSTLTGNMTLRDQDGVSPASCSQASQVQQNFNFAGASSAHGDIDFVQGQQGPFSGVTVYSFTAPYPSTAFAAIRAAVAKCPTYQETEDDGTPVTDRITVLPVPAAGEESIGLEVRSVYQGVSLDLVVVLVRSGNTLVAVEDAGAGTPASAARAEQLARLTLRRVTAA
jgi:hypothetical protein